MSQRRNWIFWTLAIAVLLLGLAAVFLNRRKQPVEQLIMAADRLEFVGEGFPLDGGSRAFFFYLPEKKALNVIVRHRNPYGGNPSFQEILLEGHRGTQGVVPGGSPLETKLIGLLRSAVIITNSNSGKYRYRNPPQPESLPWIIERMQDRKTTWE